MKKTLLLLPMAAMALISCQTDRIEHSPYINTDRWELVWNDEFDYQTRDELLKVWESANQPYSHILSSRWPENVEVTGGTVKLVNHKESRGGQDWTSGSIWTRKDFKYGYFECRYKYAAATGTNNSFWLMTRQSAPDPADGKRFELDINEGHYPNEVNTCIHNWSDTPHQSSHEAFTYEGTDFSKDYHIIGMEWTEKAIAFFVDGREVRRVKNEFSFSSAPVLLSLAIINWAGEVTDAIDGTFMEVDYVRVYKEKK